MTPQPSSIRSQHTARTARRGTPHRPPPLPHRHRRRRRARLRRRTCRPRARRAPPNSTRRNHREPLHARRRLRRPAARLRPAVDPARARPLTSPTAACPPNASPCTGNSRTTSASAGSSAAAPPPPTPNTTTRCTSRSAGSPPTGVFYYRFRAGGWISETGRTRTAPAAGARISALRLAAVSCQAYHDGYFTAYRHLAAGGRRRRLPPRRLPLRVRRRRRGRRPRTTPTARLPAHFNRETVTLEDYRLRYALYKSDPDLRAAHAAHPFVVTWDDHETENNYADDIDENDGPPEEFLLRRAAAYRAYWENQPLRRPQRPAGPDAQPLPPAAAGAARPVRHPRHPPVPLRPGVRRRLRTSPGPSRTTRRAPSPAPRRSAG